MEFGGPGAIALMPLGLSVRVNFFAKPYGLGSKLELGYTAVETSAGIFIYGPTLAVAKPEAVGLLVGEIFQVTALLRVGAPNWPALVTGFIEGLAIQIYK